MHNVSNQEAWYVFSFLYIAQLFFNSPKLYFKYISCHLESAYLEVKGSVQLQRQNMGLL